MRKIQLIILSLFFTATLFAQAKPFVLGVTEQIKSAELSETRTINIYLPAGYNKDSSRTYPVIYLLDGGVGEDFVHISGVVQFLTEIVDTLPKAIVVGIANVDRKRDFTFAIDEAYKKDIPQAGGSAKFISFIEKELQPYITKHYKVSDSKTVIGQSLGGLLATEILLKKPALFDNYLIVSPSLWWHGGSLLQNVKCESSKDIQVCIAVGKEGEQMEGDARKLANNLAPTGKGSIKTAFLFLPDENHLTILHNAAYQGLEALFAGKK
jgi:predicted alpha/beta superfamily hydrolase